MLEGQTFGELVRRELGFLGSDHGFRVVRETEHIARLRSETMGVQAAFDPTRGEVDVNVFRLDSDENYERWSYMGMVGKASVTGLLEIARERMQGRPSILAGDGDFYEQLGAEQRRLSREWTA